MIRLPSERTIMRSLAMFGPVATVVLAGLATLPGPAAAHASGRPDVAPPMPTAPTKTVTPAQTKAMEWLKLHPADFAMVRVLQPLPEQEPETATPSEEPRNVEWRVTGLMTTPAGGLATINGRPVQVGEALEGGATVERIDVKAGIVILRRDSGGEVTLNWSPFKPASSSKR